MTLKCNLIRASCYLGKTLTGAITFSAFFGVIYTIGKILELIKLPEIIFPEWLNIAIHTGFLVLMGLCLIYTISLLLYLLGDAIFDVFHINFCRRKH